MEEFMQLGNFIDLDVLQNVLDNFSKATGFSFVTVDCKGVPVTTYSGFTKFCKKLRLNNDYKSICYQCDAHGGLQAAIKGEPHIYNCHAGLIDFAIPIMIKGNYLGAILAGQVKIDEQHGKTLSTITDKKCDWRNDPELKEAFDEIQIVSYEKLVSTVHTLHEISSYIVEREYINIVKKKLSKDQMRIMEEERVRSELEKALKDAEIKALYYQINPHFLFNALNTICRLAFIENAEKTEEMAYAFSDMMRYVLKKNNSQLVTFKDEIMHSKNYLKIQKMRLGDRLNYVFDVTEDYYNVKCPFMLLQPLIENSVKYVVEIKEEGGNIIVRERRRDNTLIVEVEDDGDGIDDDKIYNLLYNSKKNNRNEESIGIRNVNKRLIYLFGEEYGLEIIKNIRGKRGTIVRIKIPINSDIE